MRYADWEQKLQNKLKSLNPVYVKSFLIVFLLLNFAFLFHSVNFMFGDHDWLSVRTNTHWNEASFEGRPLHFVLQALLFESQILPFLNNIFSFAALSLSGILLAKYWNLKQTMADYTLFAALIGTLPYTLVWLYYAKDALINLSLPLIAVSALLLAEYAIAAKKPFYHLPAVLLLFFAFSSYAAVINLIGVVLTAKILFDYINRNVSFFSLIKEKLFVFADIAVALLIFKLLLVFMSSGLTSDYNTKIIGLDILPQKLSEALKVMFVQFITPLPFMEYNYKLLLAFMSFCGAGCVLVKAGGKKAPVALMLLLFALFFSKAAWFIADERGQILTEMENFAFVPRLDFYGLVYVYALFAAALLNAANGKREKIVLAFLGVLVFSSVVRDVYAQKVWKFGFDAEMKAHERIVSRIEQFENFSAFRKYKLLQVGSLSLRENYYKKTPGEEKSLDLLSTSFTPQFMSRIVYNFYYPEDVFYANAAKAELSPKGREWLLYKAKPFPNKDFIYIDGDILIIVLTDEGLNKARSGL